jgi:RNA polymerase sigma-70 factor, ECF subfamily
VGDVEAVQRAEAAARHSYGKLVAFLSARTRDVAGAEDALSEAFAAALQEWPRRGVPAAPEAWLLTVARRRMVDDVRRRIHDEAASEYFLLVDELSADDDPPELPDRRLELLFACAHPGIDAAARAPLMLQTVLGFEAGAIASAFLVAPAAMSQRLVRAKAKIRQAGIPFSVPGPAELPERLDAVLAAIYAAYAEGWVDAEGADARRRNLAEEAIWLGRLLAHLLPKQAEALGLLALMLHAHARRAARRDTAGDYVPLGWQDTARWDHAMIDEAEALLQRANTLAAPGRYQLEAAVQSAHAVRRHGAAVPWVAIVQLYDGLRAITPSPVAELNRAVALSHVQGAQAGLDALPRDARLADYQPYWAALADLHARAGDRIAAAAAYERAIGLESDGAVRRFLQQRAASLGDAARP